MDELKYIFAFFSFWTGACIASFLNVVIWRVPRGESIVSPGSHCPKCGAAIKWYQNIPILSWLALRGKCANCREPISPRYILIEALGGALFLAAFLHLLAASGSAQNVLGVDWLTLAVWWIWIALMIVGSMIDFDHKLLPDFVTVGGMILGVGRAVAKVCLGASASAQNAAGGFAAAVWAQKAIMINSLAGLAFGFGLLWLVRWLGSKAFGREAMGMGDVFLMGAIGALFGPAAVLVALILSSVFGSVVGLGLIALSKTKFGRFLEIPYGPYICMGCLVWMFYGEALVKWYLHLLRF